MQNIRIVLLFAATAYFVTAEALNLIIKDLSYSPSDDYNDDVSQWLKSIQSDEITRHNEYKKVNTLVNLIRKLEDQKHRKSVLRVESYSAVQDFLRKLNNYIERTTQNHHYEKRDACRSGFVHPGWNECKRNKARRHNKNKSQKTKEDQLNYAQHMVFERARTSSESNSAESDADATLRHKSRFRIVDNAKKQKRKGRQKSSSEQSSSDETHRDKESSVEQKVELSVEQKVELSVENSDSSAEKPREDSEEFSNKRHKRKEIMDENFMYLQSTRLKNPNFRSGKKNKKAGRRMEYRMPHFLPKRFKWDANMLQHLDDHWIGGIKAYETHHKKYERHWPYQYWK